MATILRRGTPPQKLTYTCVCRRCNSKIEFTAEEGVLTYDPRDGNYLTFKCLVCEAPITHAA
jgi:hypothetical protein